MEMKKHYTYILYSKSSDKYYTGSSKDLENRLQRHNAGATKSTKRGRPWEIVYFEEYDSKSEAMKRESYIKRMKSRKYIEGLIEKFSGSCNS